jgi:predicted  nucleic acid-binding Zn-ribbon protein
MTLPSNVCRRNSTPSDDSSTPSPAPQQYPTKALAMADDPFAALEKAVEAVERTAAALARQGESLQKRLEDQTARAETLQDTKRGVRDGEARLDALEKERAAVRERLRRVRDLLAEVSLTVPESTAS